MAREITAKVLPQKLLLKNARLIDLLNKRDEVTDIIISDGKIDTIGKATTTVADTIDLKGKIVTHGLIDMHVHLREPGREDKETILTGCNAAMAGGFTAVACMPNTMPPIDTADTVHFIKSKAQNHLVDVYPVGCVSKKREGKELAEIGHLVEAGVVGISDDGDPVYNAEIMRRALEYVKMYRIPVIEHAEDKQLSNKGSMNEGFTSTRLGLRGIPNISEEVVVARDILLAEYTGSHVHIAHISTGGTVRLVREAKKRGVNVTCEVCPHHFTLTDAAVENYDTFAKMNPPLRESKDLEEIKRGLQDGTIDVIATDHAPHTVEDKECEFDQAAFGITGLETCIGIAFNDLVHKNVISLHSALEKMAIAPRKILNLPIPQLTPGSPANLSIIDPEKTWTYDVTRTCSKGVNTPYNGYTMKGKAFGVINKGKIFIEE
ncbi:dihydroorotase [bacterium]|nr:dihydroorotase [bacterium]